MSVIRWAKLLEDNPLLVMDRLRGLDNAYITQASLATVTYRVFEYASYEDCVLDRNGSEVGVQASVTIASSIFDTLQTDSYWTDDDGVAIDAVGYNFRFQVPTARFPNAGKWYGIEFTFTPPIGETWKIKWGASTVAVGST